MITQRITEPLFFTPTEHGYIRPTENWTEFTQMFDRSNENVAALGREAARMALLHNSDSSAFYSTVIDFGHHASPPIQGTDLEHFEKAAFRQRHEFQGGDIL